MSFLGKHVAVDYSLLKNLNVFAEKKSGETAVNASGQIMESAKVFESLEAKAVDQQLFITVYASLAFWNKKGSPDFSTNVKVSLRPGRYEVWYRSPKEEPIQLGSLKF